MTITFNKTGTLTGSFLGDRYRSEYVFSNLNELPIATFTYANFRATIKVNDTIYRIEPVPGSWTCKYLILHEESTLGKIKVGPWFNRMSIELTTGKIFKLERRYKSLWERLTNHRNYFIQLEGDGELVFYEFVKGVRFEKWNFNARYKELKGKIDFDIDNIAVSLFGVFLIEQLLDLEGG